MEEFNLSATEPSARKIVSWKDIQIAYLVDGLDGVKALWESKAASKKTIRRALKFFRETKKDTSDLERWVADNIGAIGRGRGRGAPQKGETRSYKAQQSNTGKPTSGPFLRLPLDSLGVKKGDAVRVKFDANQIVVSL